MPAMAQELEAEPTTVQTESVADMASALEDMVLEVSVLEGSEDWVLEDTGLEDSEDSVLEDMVPVVLVLEHWVLEHQVPEDLLLDTVLLDTALEVTARAILVLQDWVVRTVAAAMELERVEAMGKVDVCTKVAQLHKFQT